MSAKFLNAIGRVLAAALLTVLLSLEFLSLSKFPYFIPSSNVEEVVNTYTTANNYIEYGFWNSRFRQDLSNSPDPADHPYVYTRFPPGPDILTSLILRFSRGSYKAVYLVFALIFLTGIPFYLKFAERVLQKWDLKGASYTLLILTPWSILATLGRFQSTPQPLLIFLPLVALDTYYRTHKRWYLYLALVVGFLSSLYLEYSLIAVLCCWLLLYLTQLLPLQRKHLLAFMGTVALGIGVNLGFNFLLLGLKDFIQEFAMTIGNRMFGVPSKEEMADFYRSIAVVHHGSPPFDLGKFLAQTRTNLEFPGMGFVLLTVVLLVVGTFLGLVLQEEPEKNLQRQRSQLGHLLKLWLWILGVLLIPALLFPAFSQSVSLYSMRTNIYFLGIGAVAIVGLALQESARFWDLARQYWWQRLGDRAVAVEGIWSATVALLLLSAPIAFALRPWALHGKLFFWGYCGVSLAAVVVLTYPASVVWILEYPRKTIRFAGGLATLLLLGLAPALFLHRSNNPILFGLYSPSYLLFLGGYSLGIALAVWVFWQPKSVMAILQPLRLPKRAIRVASAIAGTIALALTVAVAANKPFQEFIGSWITAYLLAYLLAITGCAGVGFVRPNAIASLVKNRASSAREDLVTSRQTLPAKPGTIRAIVATGLILSVLLGTRAIAATNIAQLEQIRAAIHGQPNYTYLLDLRQFSGKLYMTNVYTSTTGFFAQSPGYGVCSPDSLSDSGKIDVSQCQVAFMKQHDLYATQKPKYFFFMRSYYPGFADCIPEGGTIQVGSESTGCVGVLYRNLSRGFVKIFENPLFEVYDLHRPLKKG